ncbi:hypothetical protein [uncultured Gemmiger sp.]|uniref:hypothetical protein n=1 Tax=uncultured Gemmiger sp. TaxID=1623490 RepID=UPI0025E059CC|nr:hypothetical protein [uncultured Gemmiger sp.]
MKHLNDKQKNSILLMVLGMGIAVLAIRPPRWLTRVYLVLERAVAACLGVLLAAAGAAALLGLANTPNRSGEPVYTIHYEEGGAETAGEDNTNQ